MAKKDKMGMEMEDMGTPEPDLTATAPPEELGPTVETETIAEGTGPESPAVGFMTHTIDELPQLATFKEGDDITFKVSSISDDGKSYDLELVSAPATTETPMNEMAATPGMGISTPPTI